MSDLFSSKSLKPAEIEQILKRIDENLAMRPGITRPSATQIAGTPLNLPPLPLASQIAQIDLKVRTLQQHGAPLFMIHGTAFRRFAKRCVNVPLRLLGRRQKLFNLEVIETLNLISAQLLEMNKYSEYSSRLAEAVEQLRRQADAVRAAQQTLTASVAAQSKQLQTLQQAREVMGISAAEHSEQLQALQQAQQRRFDELLPVLEEVKSREQSLRASFEAFSALQEAQEKRLGQLAIGHDGVSKWVDLISRKQQRLALDLREGPARAIPTSEGLPEPRIVNEKEYSDKIARMRGQLKVNLGCGEKPWPEYLNVDLHALQDVDIVADARRLPFEPGSLAELASAHLVEHFREHQLRASILPYWKSLLQPGGVLRIICPNWAAMVKELTENRMSWPDFKLISFGAQDYETDDHFAMYTPETLTALLKEAGFREVEIVALDRRNGICPEMELVVHP